MTDFIAERLPLLEAHRIAGLDLGENFIYPNYHGNSILNLPSSVCALLGIPELGSTSLDTTILEPVGDGVQRVILVLMDAMALHRLQRWMNNGTSPVWKRLADRGVLAPITSITPSTTCAALTTLWTGRSPKEHGIVGYEMWMKEYGVIANMILHSPASFYGSVGSLGKAGFNPREYLPFKTLGTHLREYGVQAHAYQHYSIAQSGLSQMFMNDVDVHPFGTPADLWVGVRHLLETRLKQRMYIWVYWGQVDHLSHHYGPDDERPEADFANFSSAFENQFLNRISSEAGEDTVVILVADHGQINTPLDDFYVLENHNSLYRRLHMAPTGENRLMYFYVRPGQSEAVREYVERTWMKQFKVLDSVYAAQTELFGPGEMHPRLLDRLGDLMAFPGGNGYLWWANERNFLLGRHGGLHREEMIVPFLAARL